MSDRILTEPEYRAWRRIAVWQDKLRARHDHEYLAHAGKTSAGVKWQRDFRTRSIPRHRALTVWSIR